MPDTRVAFLGLGTMGAGMAARLLAAGFPLAVYNRSPERAAPLAAAGARAAQTPVDAAKEANVIISMLADDTASRAVWLGDDGALSSAKPNTILIECGTVSQEWIRELSAAARKRSCPLIDAPVTGSKTHAANGELTFLAGSDAATLEAARPVLAAMSKEILHIGPTGSGALLKLINNFLCGVQVAALAEGLAMIERSGLDRDKALQVVTHGAPGSPLVKTMSARMTARDYRPNFHLHLMAKDLQYAIKEASTHGLSLTTAAAALALLQQAVAAEHATQDLSAVAEIFR